MRQTMKGSIAETCMDMFTGTLLSFPVQEFIIKPLYDLPTTSGQSFQIVMIFTVVSFLRRIAIRRVFNYIKWGHK